MSRQTFAQIRNLALEREGERQYNGDNNGQATHGARKHACLLAEAENYEQFQVNLVVISS